MADVFARSDATELPELMGVSRRTLFTFHDLYFHLAESEDEMTGRLGQARAHALFRDVSRELASYIRPYDPSWREPKDALATPFYTWQRHE